MATLRIPECVIEDVSRDIASIVASYDGHAVGTEKLAYDLERYFAKNVAFFDSEEFFAECGLTEEGRLP